MWAGRKGAIAAALAALLGAPAAADEMMKGGFGANLEGVYAVKPLTWRGGYRAADAPDTPDTKAGFTFDFTPRESGSLFTDVTGLKPPEMRLSLGVEEGWSDRLRLDAVGLASGTRDERSGLALGGALAIDELTFTGGLGSAHLLGEDADLVAAGLQYGPLQARLVYGQLPNDDRKPDGLVMFSTDLAAWSWLTLEGDVAYSDDVGEEGLAVGRLGVRLRF